MARKGSPFYIACTQGPVELIRTMVKLGANINATDDAGYSPLVLAIQNNNADLVCEILRFKPVISCMLRFFVYC